MQIFATITTTVTVVLTSAVLFLVPDEQLRNFLDIKPMGPVFPRPEPLIQPDTNIELTRFSLEELQDNFPDICATPESSGKWKDLLEETSQRLLELEQVYQTLQTTASDLENADNVVLTLQSQLAEERQKVLNGEKLVKKIRDTWSPPEGVISTFSWILRVFQSNTVSTIIFYSFVTSYVTLLVATCVLFKRLKQKSGSVPPSASKKEPLLTKASQELTDAPADPSLPTQESVNGSAEKIDFFSPSQNSSNESNHKSGSDILSSIEEKTPPKAQKESKVLTQSYSNFRIKGRKKDKTKTIQELKTELLNDTDIDDIQSKLRNAFGTEESSEDIEQKEREEKKQKEEKDRQRKERKERERKEREKKEREEQERKERERKERERKEREEQERKEQERKERERKEREKKEREEQERREQERREQEEKERQQRAENQKRTSFPLPNLNESGELPPPADDFTPSASPASTDLTLLDIPPPIKAECKEGTFCPQADDSDHERSFEHPFLHPCPKSPFCEQTRAEHFEKYSHVCLEGMQCKKLKDEEHLTHFYHIKKPVCDEIHEIKHDDEHHLLFSHEGILDYRKLCTSCSDPSTAPQLHLAEFFHYPQHSTSTEFKLGTDLNAVVTLSKLKGKEQTLPNPLKPNEVLYFKVHGSFWYLSLKSQKGDGQVTFVVGEIPFVCAVSPAEVEEGITSKQKILIDEKFNFHLDSKDWIYFQFGFDHQGVSLQHAKYSESLNNHKLFVPWSNLASFSFTEDKLVSFSVGDESATFSKVRVSSCPDSPAPKRLSRSRVQFHDPQTASSPTRSSPLMTLSASSNLNETAPESASTPTKAPENLNHSAPPVFDMELFSEAKDIKGFDSSALKLGRRSLKKTGIAPTVRRKQRQNDLRKGSAHQLYSNMESRRLALEKSDDEKEESEDQEWED